MPQISLSNHAEMLVQRASWQAGFQVPQSPAEQQLLWAGVNARRLSAVHTQRHRGATQMGCWAGITEDSSSNEKNKDLMYIYTETEFK